MFLTHLNILFVRFIFHLNTSIKWLYLWFTLLFSSFSLFLILLLFFYFYFRSLHFQQLIHSHSFDEKEKRISDLHNAFHMHTHTYTLRAWGKKTFKRIVSMPDVCACVCVCLLANITCIVYLFCVCVCFLLSSCKLKC